ncbi:MAG: hypothetical protein QOD85_137 [Gaiellaceae bacterium]|nr:hypothetical protein [Gaiellaceae bacterium]
MSAGELEKHVPFSYARGMRPVTRCLLAVGICAALTGASFGSSVYDGPATRAAARADKRAHITRPDISSQKIGSPTTRFAFVLPDNKGEVEVYRTPKAALGALAFGERLAKAFGGTLKGYVSVYGNVIIGFDKLSTARQRRETRGWLRTG